MVLTLAIAAAATAGVILRPFGAPEAIWAVTGAALLVLAGLLPMHDALAGILQGSDVYLFLTGMMLLSELARHTGLFAWLAAHAARSAHGSGQRLFTLIFGVGTLVTIFLSNDATAVVLTPAVAAAARTAGAANARPYLFICAFVANAASFVLPISNPANLVIYGQHMPRLLQWLPHFALPSVLAIAATYAVLRFTQRRHLRAPIDTDIEAPPLPSTAIAAAGGIAATTLVLLAASVTGWQLGLPTCLAGAATALLVWSRDIRMVRPVLRGISWSVLPLVAGLFVLVAALGHTGLIALLAHRLQGLAQGDPSGTALGTGAAAALLCNLMNNLPLGLIAGQAAHLAQLPSSGTAALLIGIDIGPNLSVTGSLATILWLAALRREGQGVSAWEFLKLGVLVMPPALALALIATTR